MTEFKGNRAIIIPTLVSILLLSIIGALFFGAYHLSIQEIWSAVFLNDNSANRFLILQIRLPRIALSALIGAGLSVSGAAIQGLFRNPLADQTLIGVTSGAMLFAVLSIVLSGSILAQLSELFKQSTIALAAFIGGLLTTYLVYFLSSSDGRTKVTTMLLAGIAISAFAAAISGIFIYLSDDEQLRDITFWSLGSFSGANWIQVLIVGPIVLIGIIGLMLRSKALNAILLGEKEAVYLGIEVEKVKSRVMIKKELRLLKKR